MNEKWEQFHEMPEGAIVGLCFGDPQIGDNNSLHRRLVGDWMVQNGLGKAAISEWFDSPHGPAT